MASQGTDSSRKTAASGDRSLKYTLPDSSTFLPTTNHPPAQSFLSSSIHKSQWRIDGEG
jgi:hypothetical protein